MRLCALAVLILLTAPAQAGAEEAGLPEARPFSISSLNTAFAMQGEFEGEYRVFPDLIELRVTRADIRVSEHCPYKGRRLLAAINLALATGIEGKQWRLAGAGQEFYLGQVMRPGDSYSLGELYFYIPIDDSIDLSQHWLVMQMEDNVPDVAEEERLKGYAFAHSCRDVFTRKN